MSAGNSQSPATNMYGNQTLTGDQGIHDSPYYRNDDSSTFMNKGVSPMEQSVPHNYYSIGPPKPTPGGGGDGPQDESWLKKNIVLVIVVGVVGFMVLAALLYCLCCKSKQGYHNALYDEESSMKARIQ